MTRGSAARALRPAPVQYGTSFWLDRVGRKPAPPVRLTADLETDVAIVGGGLTGCLAACLFARAGITVYANPAYVRIFGFDSPEADPGAGGFVPV